jgi:uncharacterized protein YoxC
MVFTLIMIGISMMVLIVSIVMCVYSSASLHEASVRLNKSAKDLNRQLDEALASNDILKQEADEMLETSKELLASVRSFSDTMKK